jgi:DNA-binding response OmpR family regulator
MDAYEEHLAAQQEGYVLVVDDVATTRAVHTLILAKHFEVKNVASGQAALETCAERLPDLVLLDVEMPGLNGFDTCRKLRAHYDIPIIFATSHESLDEHLKAFDVGGTDLCVKPLSAEILIRKARLAIAQRKERLALQTEKENLQARAEQYQSDLVERKLLLQFTRASLNCSHHAQLAQNYLHAAQRLGVQACITIRSGQTESAWSPKGEASELERAVLSQIAGMGQIVQFKNRLALNYGQISVVVSNMPEEDSADALRIRENMGTLTEMAAALAERINTHSPPATPSAPAPEDDVARMARQKTSSDIRLLLQEMLDGLDATFDLMATDKSQEEHIMHAVREPLERILTLLDQST